MTTTTPDTARLSADSLDRLFTEAHTAYAWDGQPVDDAVLSRTLRAATHGPTAFNTQPMRVLAVRGADARARLGAHLSGSNRAKTVGAPLTLVLAADAGFADTADTVAPQAADLIRTLYGDTDAAEPAARLNAALQAGYLIIALRAEELAVGPMTGADFAGIDAEFFPGRPVRSFVVLNVGYPTHDSYRPRNPRVAEDLVLQTV